MQCSVYIAMSVDGFIARPDGGLDWLAPMQAPGEDYGFKAFFDSVDAVVLGRNTYAAVLGFAEWPYEGKRVVVLAHSTPPPRHGEAFFSGSPAALVERLAADGVRRAYVDGGAVVSQFLDAGLVDDLTLSVVPVVLGDGIRLFHAPVAERGLVLDGTAAFPTGLVQLRYRLRDRA